jgi:hypothetical protein
MPKPNLASMSIDALLKLPAEEGESVKEDRALLLYSQSIGFRFQTFKRRSIPTQV